MTNKHRSLRAARSAAAIVLAAMALAPASLAHCDTLDGPWRGRAARWRKAIPLPC